MPRVLPRAVFPSGKTNRTSRSGCSQTCATVRTRPSAETTTPLPLAPSTCTATTAGEIRVTRAFTCCSIDLRSSSDAGVARPKTAGNRPGLPMEGLGAAGAFSFTAYPSPDFGDCDGRVCCSGCWDAGGLEVEASARKKDVASETVNSQQAAYMRKLHDLSMNRKTLLLIAKDLCS